MKLGGLGRYRGRLHTRVRNRVWKGENSQGATRFEHTPSAQAVRVEGGHKKTQVSKGCTHGLSTRRVIKPCVLAEETWTRFWDSEASTVQTCARVLGRVAKEKEKMETQTL